MGAPELVRKLFRMWTPLSVRLQKQTMLPHWHCAGASNGNQDGQPIPTSAHVDRSRWKDGKANVLFHLIVGAAAKPAPLMVEMKEHFGAAI